MEKQSLKNKSGIMNFLRVKGL